MPRIRKGTDRDDVLSAGREDRSAFWFGRDGDDDISGGSGRDILFGGLGDDTLMGGIDNRVDVLFGGRGADTFQFMNLTIGVTGRDVIGDFSRAQGDKIDLTYFYGATFIDDAAFSAGGHIEVQDRNGVLRVDGDGDGDVDFRIKVGVDVTLGDLIL